MDYTVVVFDPDTYDYLAGRRFRTWEGACEFATGINDRYADADPNEQPVVLVVPTSPAALDALLTRRFDNREEW